MLGIARTGIQVTLASVARGNGLRQLCSGGSGSYKNILVEKKGDKSQVGFVRLNRPKALNSLCDDLLRELNVAFREFDADPSVKAIVLTGSSKAFAAGADIKEMQPKTYSTVFGTNFINDWTEMLRIRKPIIAAVNGYALGGGCELAMMCDIIYAGDSAKFAQPEIRLGTIPGAGGTQRLPRAVGKSKAMEMCLTGDMITAKEAESAGLVSKVVPADKLEAAALDLAERISRMSLMAIYAAKESVNAAYEAPLSQGLLLERRLFHASFGTRDRSEGMSAFTEKRAAEFKDE
uniref:Probable enoyl-CoA hydratase, mitochondrial n=1 Tax=Macrostomum lignano TaxID=282301 RepID=A0A1I8IZ27_9PLAT